MTTTLKNADVLHLLTGRTPLNINRLLSHYLKEDGIPLTREQWTVMAILWKADGCTQQDLADATYRDRPGITRLLDNLQKENLIERKPHETDRRTNRVFITEKGRNLEKPVIKALNKTIETATKNISNEQLETLRITFNQINENIQAVVL